VHLIVDGSGDYDATGSASSCSRAAILTPSPKMSEPSTITSPRLMPIANRNLVRVRWVRILIGISC